MEPNDPTRQSEILAASFVREWVGDRGEVTDTGDGHGPDFRIDYADDRTAVGEVGEDADPRVEGMWTAILKRTDSQTFSLRSGAGQWLLMIRENASVKALLDRAPVLIHRLIDQGLDRLIMYGALPKTPEGDEARSLGIVVILKYGEGPPYRGHIQPVGEATPLTRQADEIVEWLDRMLIDYPDSWQKLQPLDADERHVFFFVGSRTHFLFWDEPDLPKRSPTTRSGITHYWCSDPATPEAFVWSETDEWRGVLLPKSAADARLGISEGQ